MYGCRLVPVSLLEWCNTYCVDVLHLGRSYSNTRRVIQWINYLDLEEDKKLWIISEMDYQDTRLDNGRIQ